MITRGNETKQSQKFVNTGNNAAVNTNKNNWITEIKSLGKSSSIQPISFENLFNILPAGFVSKNITGAHRSSKNASHHLIMEIFSRSE